MNRQACVILTSIQIGCAKLNSPDHDNERSAVTNEAPASDARAASESSGPVSHDGRKLPPAAIRALAEAEARRAAAAAALANQPKDAASKEFQGPKGPEPTRYGDWEKNGIASDF